MKDGFFNNLFPVETNDVNVKEKDLSKFKELVDISDNYNFGKFLTTGLSANGKIQNFDGIEKSDDKIFSLGQVITIATKHQGISLTDYVISKNELEKWKYLKGSKRIPRTDPNGNKYIYTEGNMGFPDEIDIPSRTMLTSESTVNRSSHAVYDKHFKKIRKITEIEAEIFQMFPANWTNTGMTSRKRYFMMGNALVTGIISRLEEKLKKIILSE